MVNCAIIGVDWRDLTWWQYQAVVEAWNARQPGQGGPPPLDRERALAAMAAVTRH